MAFINWSINSDYIGILAILSFLIGCLTAMAWSNPLPGIMVGFAWFIIGLIIYGIWRLIVKSSSFVSNTVKDKANSIISPNTVDKAYYATAEREIDDGTFDKGLWAKALVNAKGNKDLRKAEYLKLRAKQFHLEKTETTFTTIKPESNIYSKGSKFKYEPSRYSDNHDITNNAEKDKIHNKQFLADLAYIMGYSVPTNTILNKKEVKEKAKKLYTILASMPFYMRKSELSKELKAIAQCSQQDSLLFLNSLISMMDKADSLNAPRTEIFKYYISSLHIKVPSSINGIPENLVDAYLMASEGDKAAQCFMGHCYYNGDDVTQNYVEAIKWYQLAADQGEAEAQFGLGCCYSNGLGVSQNYAEAIKWFLLSANQNNVDAWYNLGHCYYTGEGVLQNYEQALIWFSRAAAYGDTNAQLCLGDMYLMGQGTEINPEQANYWYQKSNESKSKNN